MVLDFHAMSEKQRLQISTDRKPIRSASVAIAALLSSEGERLFSQKTLMELTCSSDNVVTMDSLGAFSVAKANSSVCGTSFLLARNLMKSRMLRI
jgi:hypothetical protein